MRRRMLSAARRHFAICKVIAPARQSAASRRFRAAAASQRRQSRNLQRRCGKIRCNVRRLGARVRSRPCSDRRIAGKPVGSEVERSPAETAGMHVLQSPKKRQGRTLLRELAPAIRTLRKSGVGPGAAICASETTSNPRAKPAYPLQLRFACRASASPISWTQFPEWESRCQDSSRSALRLLL